MTDSRTMDRTDAELVRAVREGDTAAYEELVLRYQPKVFAMARRYARRDSEVEDIVQEVFVKAFQKLNTFRGDAPFEHWFMRLSLRTCYDALRQHQRNREFHFTDLAPEAGDWLDRFVADDTESNDREAAARHLVKDLLDRLSPPARLVITLLEIEDRSVKEISELTGWSQATVKVRAFRARAEMRKILAKLAKEKYL